MRKEEITIEARKCGFDSHYDGKQHVFVFTQLKNIAKKVNIKVKKNLKQTVEGAGYACSFS